MDLKESCPSVSIPSSDEHREKRKRFTVSVQGCKRPGQTCGLFLPGSACGFCCWFVFFFLLESLGLFSACRWKSVHLLLRVLAIVQCENL